MMAGLRKAYIRSRLRLAFILSKPDPGVRAERPNERHIFVALAADYGNVGDLAITEAQRRYLEESFPDSVVELVPISGTLSAIKRLRQAAGADDVVALIGGGNTGDMYDDIQFLRELFITRLPNLRQISFPQTIEFSDTLYGRWARRRARRVYRSHPRLVVMARDRRSRESAAALVGDNTVVTAPDVVLTVDATCPVAQRSGTLLVLRNDLERGIDDAAKDVIISSASKVGPVAYQDTHLGDVRVTPADAQDVLDRYWTAWRETSLVVTDRLHGMIFAVITGAPCIALDSGTGKVSQFYRDWLQGEPSVVLMSEVSSESFERARRSLVSAQSGSDALRKIFLEQFAFCRAELDIV